MANVIKTVLTYQLDGSNRDFNIPFEYLARKFVVVTLIGVDRKVLTLNTDYRFATRTTISLTKSWGPADGYTTIELRRVTSTTDRLVDFTDGSILRAYDLNVAQIQTMHVAEEARDLTADTIGVSNDGHLDARGRRIVNLANAVDDRDAVPFGQLKTMNQNSWQARNEALQFRNEAETFRNQVEGFKNESGTNAANTKRWRDDAKGFRDEAEQFKNTAGQYSTSAGNSATAAHQSEVNAENSATASANSAHLAEQQADRAEREADKLENFNELAGAIDRVDGASVHWKGEIHANGRLYLTTNGFYCGQYQQFFGNVPNRYSVMEWGDKDGWHLYSERPTEGGTPTLNLRGHIVSWGNVRAGGNSYANNLFEMDREQHWPGSGAFANQYADRAAPFTKTGRYRAPNGYGVYYPIVKAFVETQDHGYGTVATFGMLTSGGGRFANGCVHVIGDSGVNGLWQFDPNTGGFLSRGDVHVGDGGVVYQNGDIYGTVWGNRPISQWLGDQTVNHIAMGGVNWSQLWNAYGIEDGGGKVITGIVNSNADGAVDGCHWRVMQYVRNNGQRFNIY